MSSALHFTTLSSAKSYFWSLKHAKFILKEVILPSFVHRLKNPLVVIRLFSHCLFFSCILEDDARLQIATLSINEKNVQVIGLLESDKIFWLAMYRVLLILSALIEQSH